uniref:Innexin n=1 Tax=Strongyloides papillosus TaxID=174720 RepID=A0A0N5BI66_STREA
MLPIPLLADTIKGWFDTTSFDDPVDRLNYLITASILGFFATMVSAKQYIGKPIQCIVPKEFSKGWEQYAEDYCFVQNTFYVPFNETIPEDYDERRQKEIGYYQWVPIVLVIQTVLFFTPSLIWKNFNSYSGVDLNTVITDGLALRKLPPSAREETSFKLKNYIADCVEFSDTYKMFRVGCLNSGKCHGRYMATLYLFVKFLYLLNILGQFMLLNSFLGDYYSMWGWKAIQFLWFGKEWHTSHVFPRVTFCDFDVRGLGDIRRFTVQCVLMINLFNEKIYLFLWFWFFLVGITTTINFFYCLIQFVSHSRRHSAIKYLIKHMNRNLDPYEFNIALKYFTADGLKPDGFLIIKFLERNAGAIVAREITQKLFEDYLTVRKDDFKKKYVNSLFN